LSALLYFACQSSARSVRPLCFDNFRSLQQDVNSTRSPSVSALVLSRLPRKRDVEAARCSLRNSNRYERLRASRKRFAAEMLFAQSARPCVSAPPREHLSQSEIDSRRQTRSNHHINQAPINRLRFVSSAPWCLCVESSIRCGVGMRLTDNSGLSENSGCTGPVLLPQGGEGASQRSPTSRDCLRHPKLQGYSA